MCELDWKKKRVGFLVGALEDQMPFILELGTMGETLFERWR